MSPLIISNYPSGTKHDTESLKHNQLRNLTQKFYNMRCQAEHEAESLYLQLPNWLSCSLFVKYVFQCMILQLKSLEAVWRGDTGQIQRLRARGSQSDSETDRSTDLPLWSPVQSGVAAGTAPVSDGVYTRTVQRRSLSHPAGPVAWNTQQELHYTHA